MNPTTPILRADSPAPVAAENPAICPACDGDGQPLSTRQRAIRRFNERFNAAFPDGTGRSDICSAEALRTMAKYADLRGAIDLVADIYWSLNN